MKVIIAKNEQEKRLSYRLRFDTMCRDLGWLPAQDYAVPEEQDEYDKNGQSLIFLAMDDFGNAVGTLRIIRQGEMPLPIERHFELYPVELEALYGKLEYYGEISRLIIPSNRTFKNHEITFMFYKEIIKTCVTMGLTHIFASMDYRFFRLQKILGFQFADIGEPQLYMGSKTVPAILALKDLPAILRKEKPFANGR